MAEKKKKSGRTNDGNEDKRTERHYLCLSEKESEELERRRIKKGLKSSAEAIRSIMFGGDNSLSALSIHLKRQKNLSLEIKETHHQIRKIGINLNQLLVALYAFAQDYHKNRESLPDVLELCLDQFKGFHKDLDKIQITVEGIGEIKNDTHYK